MCGIIGVAAFGNVDVEREKFRQTAMVYFSSEMLLLSLKRGSEATGLSTLHTDGSYSIFKSGIGADEFTYKFGNKEGDFDHYIKKWRSNPSPAKVCIGHCRKPSYGTKATPKDNDNNHPIKVGNIVGVHNGTIKNDGAIFKGLGVERKGLVDSEAIIASLNFLTNNGKNPFNLEMLEKASLMINGSFSVLAFNGDNPFQLAAFLEDRPLEVGFIKPLGLLLFASEKEFIKKPVVEYNKIAKCYSGDFIPLRKCDFIEGKATNETVYLFDLGVEVTENTNIENLYTSKKFEPKERWSYKTTTYTYNQHNPVTVVHNKKSVTQTTTNNVDTKESMFVKKAAEFKEMELTVTDTHLVRRIETEEVDNKPVEVKENFVKEVDNVNDTSKTEEKTELVTKEVEQVTVHDTEIIKKAVAAGKNLEPFRSNTDVATELGIKEAKSINNMQKYALANRVRRNFFSRGFMDGYKLCMKDLRAGDITVTMFERIKNKNLSAQKKIRSLKAVIQVLAESIRSGEIPPELIKDSVKTTMKSYPFLNSTLFNSVLRNEIKRYPPLKGIKNYIYELEGIDEKETDTSAVQENDGEQKAGQK